MNGSLPPDKLFKTIGYYLAFIAFGLTVAALGPNLLHLAENTQVTLKAISGLFTARSLGFLIGAFLGGRLFDRLPLWRRAPLTETSSDGLFVLDGLSSVGVNETVVTLEGRPADGMDLELTALYRAATGGGIQKLPHLPNFAVGGMLGLRGPWRISTQIHLQHMADRYGDVAGGSDRRLSAATDLGVRFALPVAETVTAWLELRNLLGQKMVIWEGYPMPGRATAMGISMRF